MRALALVLLLVASPAFAGEDEPLGTASARDSAREVLGEERYRFCHEDRYPLYQHEREWCDVIAKDAAACPSLPKACEAKVDPKAELGDFWESGKNGGDGEDELWQRSEPSGDDARKEKEEPWKLDFELPAGLSVLAQIVMYLLLAVIVGAILWGLWSLLKNLRKSRGDDDSEAPPAPPVVGDEEAAAVARQVETDVDRLLARARAAAARGDYERAIEDAYAAVLRRLEGDGLVDLHPWRTNGEYLRSLGARPELRQALRPIVRDVEAVQFGSTPASAGLFDSLLSRILPIVGRAATVVLLLLSAVALCACPGDGSGSSGRSGTSPSGTRAVLEVLQKQGLEAHYRLDPLTKIEGEIGTIVVLPGAEPEDDDWQPLLDWVRDDGGQLVLAGTFPVDDPFGVTPVALEHALPSTLTPADEWPSGPIGWLAGLELRVPPSMTALELEYPAKPLLWRDQSVYAAQTTHGLGNVFLFADADLFTNVALAVGDNAEVLPRMIAGRGPVELCDAWWTGAGSSNPLEALGNAHLTPVVLQLLALLVLFLLFRGIAFGRLRDPPAASRRSFAEHVRALGQQYARGDASSHVLGAYAQWAIERLRERSPRGAQRGLSALAAAIAARTGRPETEVLRILVESQSASDVAGPPSHRPVSVRDYAPSPVRAGPARDLQLMRELDGFLAVTKSEQRKT